MASLLLVNEGLLSITLEKRGINKKVHHQHFTSYGYTWRKKEEDKNERIEANHGDPTKIEEQRKSLNLNKELEKDGF